MLSVQIGFMFESIPKASPGSGAKRSRRKNTAVSGSTPRAQLLLLPDPPPLAKSRRDQLEHRLRELIGPFVVLKLTKNVSTMISTRRRGRVLYIRVHAMFTDAPPEVVDALAAFVSTDRISKNRSKTLDIWIESKRELIAAARESEAAQPFGEHHDLQSSFDRLNQKYFEGRIHAKITWTYSAQKKRRNSIQMGSYSDDLKLIRIHPALDQEWVPRYFVEFVIYHEMLHQVHPRSLGAPKGCTVHTPSFRSDERKFEQFVRAQRFETLHLERLLRY
jgi:hypothetical protein